MQKPATLNHVSGKVFYKGMLLRNGIIVFTPDATRGETGKIAFGIIKDDGSYTHLPPTTPPAPPPAGIASPSSPLSGSSHVLR